MTKQKIKLTRIIKEIRNSYSKQRILPLFGNLQCVGNLQCLLNEGLT